MTLCHNTDNRLVATPLLMFYMELGIQVEELYYALQYCEATPFSKFVDELVDIRVKSFGVNAPLGDRAKFSLNSAIGRFGLNIEKHRDTRFVLGKNLYRHTNTPRLDHEHHLQSVFGAGTP